MEPILIASGISKNYGQVPVLQELELKLYKGESIAIVGQSGCGKTTLLTVMAGLEPPDAGNIHVLGRDLYTLSNKELGRLRGENMGIVFQDYHLVPSLPAIENVSLPLEILNRSLTRSDIHQKAMALLQRVGLESRAHHFPHQLSGGEQQRVAVARALVANPKIIFADEPTGNLDENTAREIEALFFSLISEQGVAVILVTHNADLASRCNRILRLHGGRLA